MTVFQSVRRTGRPGVIHDLVRTEQSSSIPSSFSSCSKSCPGHSSSSCLTTRRWTYQTRIHSESRSPGQAPAAEQLPRSWSLRRQLRLASQKHSRPALRERRSESAPQFPHRNQFRRLPEGLQAPRTQDSGREQARNEGSDRSWSRPYSRLSPGLRYHCR